MVSAKPLPQLSRFWVSVTRLKGCRLCSIWWAIQNRDISGLSHYHLSPIFTFSCFSMVLFHTVPSARSEYLKLVKPDINSNLHMVKCNAFLLYVFTLFGRNLLLYVLTLFGRNLLLYVLTLFGRNLPNFFPCYTIVTWGLYYEGLYISVVIEFIWFLIFHVYSFLEQTTDGSFEDKDSLLRFLAHDRKVNELNMLDIRYAI